MAYFLQNNVIRGPHDDDQGSRGFRSIVGYYCYMTFSGKPLGNGSKKLRKLNYQTYDIAILLCIQLSRSASANFFYHHIISIIKKTRSMKNKTRN